jgi:hypothetical protein
MFTALYIVLYGVYYLLSLPRCCWLPRLIPAHTALSISLSLAIYGLALFLAQKQRKRGPLEVLPIFDNASAALRVPMHLYGQQNKSS